MRSPLPLAAVIALSALALYGASVVAASQASSAQRVPIPGSAHVPPGGHVVFVPSEPVMGSGLTVVNRSDQPAVVSLDASPLVTIKSPVGFVIHVQVAGI